ncbi:MAG: hypothetical protein KBT27_16025 [Prevotellaceae bacterium]|nr:hypothetical protein [Candidatus Faecinaster equi]
MNRIVLIGNGFDLAHGLKTSYQDFIRWYWEQIIDELCKLETPTYKNELGEITCRTFRTWSLYWEHKKRVDGPIDPEEFLSDILYGVDSFEQHLEPFFENICEQVGTIGWVDVEYEYYQQLKKLILHSTNPQFSKVQAVKKLNAQLVFIQKRLIDFLNTKSIPQTPNERLKKILYEPIMESEVAVSRMADFYDHVDAWLCADNLSWELRYDRYDIQQWQINNSVRQSQIKDIKQDVENMHLDEKDGQKERVKLALKHNRLLETQWPDDILFVNFNYTSVAELYVNPYKFQYVTIHGNLSEPESIVFGYGDDVDNEYKEIQSQNENVFMDCFKTNMYMERDNYRKVLQFAESEPYQVYIIGLSCGTSDRTLLHTLFEHSNCVSIKPFFYRKSDGSDTFRELQMNIARNFTDSKKMRERVVNKVNTTTYSDDREQK